MQASPLAVLFLTSSRSESRSGKSRLRFFRCWTGSGARSFPIRERLSLDGRPLDGSGRSARCVRRVDEVRLDDRATDHSRGRLIRLDGFFIVSSTRGAEGRSDGFPDGQVLVPTSRLGTDRVRGAMRSRRSSEGMRFRKFGSRPVGRRRVAAVEGRGAGILGFGFRVSTATGPERDVGRDILKRRRSSAIFQLIRHPM